ncbi:ribbon-helix-helix protein, CopG family [Paracoccus wurundjeri]|uniref:ribbon-helix-helix protein, CopG family n=1 Tax=Paracoccus onubensis TaxID=1675788 RepID=UPI00351D33B4
MAKQEKTPLTRKGKRGPAPTGWGTLVGVRLQPDLLEWLDAECAKQDDQPSRPEMIRRILERLKT